MSEKVIFYIDGFNLYFGMREAKLDKCRWLNLKTLAVKLIKQNQQLMDIKYFTSRVNGNPGKVKRQSTYIDALESVGIKIIYGHYQSGSVECKSCGHSWSKAKEKMTDVNIATNLIVDALEDKYDTAILVSGDSDLVPPIKAIHEKFKSKKVVVAFPPDRYNSALTKVAKGFFNIGRNNLLQSQFSEEVISKSGFKLQIPDKWK